MKKELFSPHFIANVHTSYQKACAICTRLEFFTKISNYSMHWFLALQMVLLQKISDYNGYPDSVVDCKTKFTIKLTSLILPPEYLDDETYTKQGDTW